MITLSLWLMLGFIATLVLALLIAYFPEMERIKATIILSGCVLTYAALLITGSILLVKYDSSLTLNGVHYNCGRGVQKPVRLVNFSPSRLDLCVGNTCSISSARSSM